jgi:CheY-like chemotaxis protein
MERGVMQLSQSAVEADHDPTPKRSILVAEDNPIARKLAVRQLERLGYRVDQVADGRSARRLT